MRTSRWLTFGLILLAALLVGACSGEFPAALAFSDDLADQGKVSFSTSSTDSGISDQIEFFGAVQTIAPGEWMVAGVTLAITPATEIKHGIHVGDFVKVHAFLDGAGVLTAREIELAAGGDEDNDQVKGEVEFFGVVEAMSPQAWAIAGRLVAITPQTEIKHAISVGDLVKVHAFLAADGVLTAREVELAGLNDNEEDAGEMEFFGLVGSIEANTWTVGGVVLAVTSQTEIKDLISVGDLVKVHAVVAADGTLTAREIELAEDDDQDEDRDEFEFEGTVESMGPGSWVIGGITILVTSATELEDDISVGDVVEVKGVLNTDGTVLAHEIELEEDMNRGPGSGDDHDDHDDDSGPGSGDDDDDDDDDDNSGPGKGGDD